MESSVLDIVRAAATEAVEFFKGVDTAAKAAKSVRDLVKPGETSIPVGTRDQIVALHEQLIALRAQNATLMDALTQAERALSKREDFLAEKERYVLKELSPNSLAYVHEEPGSPGEAAIKLCQHCFGNDKKSMLQHEKTEFYFDTLVCMTCGGRARIHNDQRMTIMTAPGRRGSRGLDDF